MPEIALFPSASHVLPEGKLEITIAEQRYQRMLKESVEGQRDFAMCMRSEEEDNEDESITRIPAIATKVNVVDFNALENGLLSIVVEGKTKIRILSVKHESDHLLIAEYLPFKAWPPVPVSGKHECLIEKLKLFFATMPEIGALYQNGEYDNLSWVCQRWIECLPLEVHYKQLLIAQDSPALTARFLLKLFDNPQLFDDDIN
ncbi:LON peptidase substrate-binding domain-containing protein [Photobacterium sp. CCB-ST2H9]|uniref:LON peptidase substrate-binding domain-containing protein n=1 Tax=Photobacterium sp. CCB-ST2H9 TaxID=2912855 RepID=UPI00200581ED|nr:LON peptidase substrate-binding domain-containing protein [Photobacterium sp. CCB-ST2H9]UTM56394.1 LON peptidase substrate-binding domain-containing protein [Photobacterium sp. CCB-ST2H9]